MSKMSKSKSFDDIVIEQLKKDKDFATDYLSEALAEEDSGIFLIALRRVMEARGVSMTDMAKKSGLNREHLYRILSKRGNPAIYNVSKILPVLGYHLSIESTATGKRTKSGKGGKTSAGH